MADKPEIVALTKVDALTEELIDVQAAELKAACGQEPLRISSVARTGVKQALSLIARELGQLEDLEDDGADAEEGWQP